MKRREKVLLGIIGTIYIAIFCVVLYHMWNFKYPKIVNWSGLLLFAGVGLILPAIGFVTSGVLLKKGKKYLVQQ